MAGIDKLYGNIQQYDELKEFLVKRNRNAIKYLYPREGYKTEYRPLSSFPTRVDKWLLKYCKIEWVIEQIREQYCLEDGCNEIV